jgi:DNA-binding beta-propeller fold protein YncE
MVSERIATIELPPHAKPGGFDHAAVDERGRVYVAHTANDAIDVIDGETLRFVQSVTGLTGVAGALVSDADGLVFTSNRGENTVGVLANDGAELARIPVGPKPNGLAYDGRRKILLAANVAPSDATGHFTVTVVDVAARAPIGDVVVPGRTRWAVFDPADRLFYVNIADPPAVVAVDAGGRRIVRTLPSPVAGPHGLDLDITRRRLFCACDGGRLLAISLDSGKVEETAELSGVPDVVFFNERRRQVYVAVGDPGVIDVVDADDFARLGTVQTEPGAHTIGFDARRELVYAFLPASHAAGVYRVR